MRLTFSKDFRSLVLTSREVFAYFTQRLLEYLFTEIFKYVIATKQRKIFLGIITTKDEKVYKLYFSVEGGD